MIKNIGVQLWVTNKRNEEKPLREKFFQPVGEGHLGIKGKGGLWTSSYLGKQLGSSWIQWCLGNDFGVPEDGIFRGYLLEPKKRLKVYTIDSLEEMHTLFDKYGYEMYPNIPVEMEGINWEEMSKDYDALHLTENGENLTRHGFSFFRDTTKDLKPEWKSKRMRNFYGWDCESTFHFKWNFENVEPIEIKAEREWDSESIMDILKGD